MDNYKTATILSFLFFISISLFTQTKWIFHKSHSGANHNLMADAKNNYGPGIRIPVEETWPLSSIKLKYQTFEGQNYPIVKLDTALRVMRFLDVNDSIIGCDKQYQHYLNNGVLVFDINTSQYYIYQSYSESKSTEIFIPVTDSLKNWSSNNLLNTLEEFIYSEQHERIQVKYKYLDYQLTRKLVAPKAKIVNPIVPEEIKPTNYIEDHVKDTISVKVEMDPVKEQKIKAKRNKKKPDKKVNKQQNNVLPLIVNTNIPPPSSPNKTPLYILGILTFVTLLNWNLQQRKIRKLNTAL